MAESRKLSVEQRAELERIAIRNRVKLQYQRMINDPRRPNTGVSVTINTELYMLYLSHHNSELSYLATQHLGICRA